MYKLNTNFSLANKLRTSYNILGLGFDRLNGGLFEQQIKRIEQIWVRI